ncbi:DNA-binding response regulator [Priestia aryabhattai]|jgi:DNA-binding response OmpR family regulator|uniref:response regulator transcription factor n=1 Tax=Priestia TaxID=2800373 RepID=UPI00064F13A1|nr:MULTISPECIES: response regulator transcription factor [Priestia]KML30783.1 PhoB family transcriptional regulator [Priestia aryabhattai]KMN99300.1 PhoB family transcriptional regulator [Priestia aryabhattai]KZE15102.1 PhoB family transcriptional regulator [Priestia aryabhattai]MBY0004139.1 response regulator transcription factor [Priestia aryabhattai]MBY0046576.1 response regulator transcription factor [Priestia aryabhattai]
MKKCILIVEDEVMIARALQIELEHEGYEVIVEHEGKTGLEAALNNNINLILLDVMLPGLNGIEVLRRIRKKDIYLPIILLTARDTTLDKVMGLDHGANDYITKPFEIEEVLARVRNSLRHRAIVQDVTEKKDVHLSIEDLSVNLETRDVLRKNKAIILTPKEYDLLVHLLKNQNIVLSRENILLTVWGYDYEGETNVVDVYIGHLRKKLEEGNPSPLIQTIRGVGYVMRKDQHENHYQS